MSYCLFVNCFSLISVGVFSPTLFALLISVVGWISKNIIVKRLRIRINSTGLRLRIMGEIRSDDLMICWDGLVSQFALVVVQLF